MSWLPAVSALLGMLVWSPTTCRGGDAGVRSCPRERENARLAAARIERQWPLRSSGPEIAFVREVGARLVAAAGPTARPWTFVLVRDARPNAFSIGDGRIYVTAGAVRTAADEAELAALLAHEMGHQQTGHFCDAEAPAASGVNGGLRQRLDPRQEREADAASVRLLVAAGYDPRAAITIARRASRLDHDAGTESWDESRLAELTRLVEAAPRGGRNNSKEFRVLKRQLERAGG